MLHLSSIFLKYSCFSPWCICLLLLNSSWTTKKKVRGEIKGSKKKETRSILCSHNLRLTHIPTTQAVLGPPWEFIPLMTGTHSSEWDNHIDYGIPPLNESRRSITWCGWPLHFLPWSHCKTFVSQTPPYAVPSWTERPSSRENLLTDLLLDTSLPTSFNSSESEMALERCHKLGSERLSC